MAHHFLLGGSLAVFLCWPLMLAYGAQSVMPPVVGSTGVQNPAEPPSSRLVPDALDGVGLDVARVDIVKAVHARAVSRETTRRFSDGGEELRYWFKDGAFMRVHFPEAGASIKPRAIIFSASDSVRGPLLLNRLTAILGRPTWVSGGGEMVLWHAHSESEGVVVPKPGAAFVAELYMPEGQPPSYTIARTVWYSPKER